jgi:hypothetical protein
MVISKCFEQLKRCCFHRLNCHVSQAISAHNSEEDRDSNYSDLVDDSNDKDEECNEEEEKKKTRPSISNSQDLRYPQTWRQRRDVFSQPPSS